MAARLVVAEAGPDGAGTLVREEELAPATGGSSAPVRLWSTHEIPPRLPQVPLDTYRHVGPEPGQTTWLLLEWPPGRTAEIHHTDLISYCTVVRGSVELLLDDTTAHLAAGDLLVVAGVRHGWRVGDEGCVISCVTLGAQREPAAGHQ